MAPRHPGIAALASTPSLGATDTHITAVRLAVLGIWAFVVVNTPYEYYSLLPDDAVRGVGLGRVLLETEGVREFLFSYPVLVALRWGTVAVCLIGMVRPHPTLMAPLFGAVLTLDLLTKSINGFANHGQFGILATLFVLTWHAAGQRRAWPGTDGGSSRSAGAIWLIRVLLILPYSYVGLNRVIEGGLAVFTGDALPSYIGYTSQAYSAYGLGLPQAWLGIPWIVALLKAGFAVTTMFEVCTAIALVSPVFRGTWLMTMTAFHVVTLITMNIFFWENLILIWVVFGWGLHRELQPPYLTTLRTRMIKLARATSS